MTLPWKIYGAFTLLLPIWLFPVRAISAAQIDTNGNGMSDIWEKTYATTVPGVDTDGDGKLNSEENLAGTNPRDPLSFFATKSLTFLPGNVARLVWPTVRGKRYQVQVSTDLSNWQDLGVPYVGDGADKILTLPLASTYLTGKAVKTRWDLPTGAINNNIPKVKANAANNVLPSVTGTISLLTIPQTVPNLSDFGYWIRGWIVPSTSGSYQFYLSSDEHSELWISTNALPANKSKIASVVGFSYYQQWNKYPSQLSPLISLAASTPYYFEVFHQENAGSDHLSVAWTGPGFTAPTLLDGQHLAYSPVPLSQLTGTAQPPYFRVTVFDVDSDGDGVSDADEILVGYNPNSATTTPLINDNTALRAVLVSENVVTVGSPQTRAYESPVTSARLTFLRTGNIGPINISYKVSGTASNGIDYNVIIGKVLMPALKNSVSIDVTPIYDTKLEPAETVTVRLLPLSEYRIASPDNSTVTINDAKEVLYVANLRPYAGIRSGGFGTVSLNAAGNLVFAEVGVDMGNLTGTQLRTELYVSSNGNSGTVAHTLPAGQITQSQWNFTSSSGLSKTQNLLALTEGRLYARVISSKFASGEIYGQLVPNSGWQTMPIPAAPPPFTITPPTSVDAARFLTQATFGPSRAAISALVATGSYDAWLTQQFNLPASPVLPYVRTRRAELLARNPSAPNDGYWRPLQEAWWENAVKAPDQLRQRVAFALSEIMVISQLGGLADLHEGVSNYYDTLIGRAFGNYRDLLEDVTLSPMMGIYLSMIRNQKPNPVVGSEPDENYAREVMQLFTIGLNQLNKDGTLKLNAAGMPIPTYTQADIVGLAHVFTGWSYPPPAGQTPNFIYGPTDYLRRMVPYESFHDVAEKTILNNTRIPAGQTATQDMQQALNVLFNHPNVGPFVSRHLIQKLVTSNPSPGYIYRVAAVFNNNGAGVRGDLRATVRAILLDYEARSTALLSDEAYGKQREPVIRFAHLLRALKIKPPLTTNPRLFLDLQYGLSGQVPLHAASVFNFFQPDFFPPGPIAAAGVVAPEFQITTETTTIEQLNQQRLALVYGIYTPEGGGAPAIFDTDSLLAILNRPTYTALQNQQALIDELNLILLNGRMSAALRQKLTDFFASLPSSYVTTRNDYQMQRVFLLANLIAASPEYVIQK